MPGSFRCRVWWNSANGQSSDIAVCVWSLYDPSHGSPCAHATRQGERGLSQLSACRRRLPDAQCIEDERNEGLLDGGRDGPKAIGSGLENDCRHSPGSIGVGAKQSKLQEEHCPVGHHLIVAWSTVIRDDQGRAQQAGNALCAGVYFHRQPLGRCHGFDRIRQMDPVERHLDRPPLN